MTAHDFPRRSSRRASSAALAACLALPLALGACTGDASPSTASTASTASSASASTSASAGAGAPDLQAAYQRVIHQVLPSVVEITTSEGLGSGVVYDDKGDIVTNAHVVGSATRFQVAFANSATSYPATLVGTYPQGDLAVIHVEGAPDLHPATFARAGDVAVGQIVLAMGNPLGLSSSVTNGIVSAVGRTVAEPQSPESPGATLPGTIQTSAAINPGNSGGALVDLRGRVVGIPTLAATDQQLGGGAAPGIGFAIPSSTVRSIAAQLVSSGSVTHTGRAALGARVTTVADASGQPVGVGVVSVEPQGAAAAAGIRAGDVITSVGGRPVRDTQGLAAALAGMDVGQEVPVTVVRSGDAQELQVTLGELAGS